MEIVAGLILLVIVGAIRQRFVAAERAVHETRERLDGIEADVDEQADESRHGGVWGTCMRCVSVKRRCIRLDSGGYICADCIDGMLDEEEARDDEGH